MVKDTGWRDRWLIAYEDDSFGFINGYGMFQTLTSEYSVKVLKEAISG